MAVSDRCPFIAPAGPGTMTTFFTCIAAGCAQQAGSSSSVSPSPSSSAQLPQTSVGASVVVVVAASVVVVVAASVVVVVAAGVVVGVVAVVVVTPGTVVVVVVAPLTSISTAPMSHAAPCGRATPRSSVSGGGQPAAAAIAGLPASSARVSKKLGAGGLC